MCLHVLGKVGGGGTRSMKAVFKHASNPVFLHSAGSKLAFDSCIYIMYKESLHYLVQVGLVILSLLSSCVLASC